ncbi:MAG: TolC family outer membrane protein [Alphaproteobacteria bacterium]
MLGAGVAGLALGIVGAAAPTFAQSLDEVLVETYETNPRLQAQRAQLRSIDEQVSQAFARYRPNLNIVGSSEANQSELSDVESQLGGLPGAGQGGGSGATNQLGGTSNASQTLVTNRVALNLNQNIYEGGGTVARIDGAVKQVGQQRAVLQSTEQEVFLDAVTAYTDVIAARRVVDLAITNEQRLERQRQATVDRFEVGEVTRTDVAQAEARLAGAVAERVSADGELAQAIARFESVVGFRPDDLPTRFAELAGPASLVEAQARAEKNPGLAAAEFAVDVALADVRVAQAGLLPTVDLDGSVGYTDEPSDTIGSQTDARIAATVTIPLYQTGAEYSRVRQQKQVVDQRRRELDETRRDVNQNVTEAWEGLVTASASARSFEEQVRANDIALEGVRTEAQVGARTVLDVLDAEQELFQAEVDLVDARATEVVALYTLQSAMGELTAEALGLGVEIYEPSAHYETVRTQAFGTAAGRATTPLQDIDFAREWGLVEE